VQERGRTPIARQPGSKRASEEGLWIKGKRGGRRENKTSRWEKPAGFTTEQGIERHHEVGAKKKVVFPLRKRSRCTHLFV